jgi:hypothetical protein
MLKRYKAATEGIQVVIEENSAENSMSIRKSALRQSSRNQSKHATFNENSWENLPTTYTAASVMKPPKMEKSTPVGLQLFSEISTNSPETEKKNISQEEKNNLNQEEKNKKISEDEKNKKISEEEKKINSENEEEEIDQVNDIEEEEDQVTLNTYILSELVAATENKNSSAMTKNDVTTQYETGSKKGFKKWREKLKGQAKSSDLYKWYSEVKVKNKKGQISTMGIGLSYNNSSNNNNNINNSGNSNLNSSSNPNSGALLSQKENSKENSPSNRSSQEDGNNNNNNIKNFNFHARTRSASLWEENSLENSQKMRAWKSQAYVCQL